jgi:hypothetical protein
LARNSCGRIVADGAVGILILAKASEVGDGER